MKAWNTVLVGFGRIGAGLADDPVHSRAYPYATHAQVLRDHPEFNWCAVVDVDEKARAVARDSWAVPEVVSEIGDLGDRLSIRVAVIATPPASRPAVLAALPNLKAILIEKPLAEDVQAARDFLETCRGLGIQVAVNLPRRYDPLFRDLANGGLERRVGRPMSVFGTYGNGLRNNGTHLVDLIRMLLGEVETVQAVANTALEEGPIPGDVNVAFGCRLPKGPAVMVAPVRFAEYREVGLDLWGNSGRLQIVHEGLTLISSPRGPCRALTGAHEIVHEHIDVETTDFGSALYRVYDNLAEVLCGRRSHCSGEEALATLRIVEAVRRSEKSGGMVVVPAEIK